MKPIVYAILYKKITDNLAIRVEDNEWQLIEPDKIVIPFNRSQTYFKFLSIGSLFCIELP